MIITEFDEPLTAEDARKISINNRDDSLDRSIFRKIMQNIKHSASMGYTRYQSMPETKELIPSDLVQNALKSLGYRVVIKRAYLWDDKAKDWSDKPLLNGIGREQLFYEITWG